MSFVVQASAVFVLQRSHFLAFTGGLLLNSIPFNEAVLVAKVAMTFGLFSSKNKTLGEFRYGTK
jgi:hypothetical protein